MLSWSCQNIINWSERNTTFSLNKVESYDKKGCDMKTRNIEVKGMTKI